MLNKIKNLFKKNTPENVAEASNEAIKNPFLITEKSLREATIRYNSSGSSFSISKMNEWQKYKNRYSRTLIQAKSICKNYKS